MPARPLPRWHWLHSRMHGELAGSVVRDSAAAVQRELLDAYTLIERKGVRLQPGGGAQAAPAAPAAQPCTQFLTCPSPGPAPNSSAPPPAPAPAAAPCTSIHRRLPPPLHTHTRRPPAPQTQRGVVYYGSARLKQDSPHWGRALALGRQVAELLGCTTW